MNNYLLFTLMAESEEIRNYRKQKFLERMAQKDKKIIYTEKIYMDDKDKDNYNHHHHHHQPPHNNNQTTTYQNQGQNTSQYQSQSPLTSPNTTPGMNGNKEKESVNYKDKYNDLNNLFNYQSNEVIVKKVMVIILTLLHCNCIPVFAIASYKVFISTILILEMTSYLIQQSLRNKIKAITPNAKANTSSELKNNWKILNMIDDLMGNFSFVDSAFFVFDFIGNVMKDISIIISLNIIYILYNEYTISN